VVVWIGWQYAHRVFARFRDSSALEAMYKHFTVSLYNLKEGRMSVFSFFLLACLFLAANNKITSKLTYGNFLQMDSIDLLLLAKRNHPLGRQPRRLLVHGTSRLSSAWHFLVPRSLLVWCMSKKFSSGLFFFDIR
jgi:hypothetical protein